jgi:hypothetical protein
MTRRKRRALFYALLLTFFFIGAGAVLYANGWRFNPLKLEFKKVGAIYVRSYPVDAEIHLDGQPVENKSGFFQSGTLIGDLFPGNHKLQLTLPNYETWEENVSVLPSLVSEVKYAVLIPKNYQSAATGTVENFWLLGNKVLTKDSKNNLLLGGKKIAAGGVRGWTSDFKNILTYNNALGHYFLYNTDTASNTDINLLLKKLNFNAKQDFKVFVDVEDKRTLVVLQQNKLFALDIQEPALANIYKTGFEFGGGISSSQFYFAWTEWNAKQNTSTLVVYDKFLKRQSPPPPPELHGKNSELAWISGTNKIALLQDDGSLYTYDISSDELSKIADDVKTFAFTDGGDAVAALEHNSLEIFFFNAEKDYYRFNLPDVGRAEGVTWYTDKDHLFIAYPDEIKLLDIQDTSLGYFPVVAHGRLPQYDEKNNVLYFIAADSLKSLDFPR